LAPGTKLHVEPPVAHAPVAVDLFSGCGGLAEGLLAAGIDVAASVELHPQPALTCAFNHPDTRVLVGDIRELDIDVLRDAARRNHTDRVDIVVGGPPCQGFSSAGKKQLSDPRNSLFQNYVRVIEHLRPRMFLMENVPGFQRMYGGAVYREAWRSLNELGYRTVDAMLAAKHFGVPQSRRRFVMVGWLPGAAEAFEWPVASHGGPVMDLLGTASSQFVPAGDALDDLAFLHPGYEATRYQDVCDTVAAFASARRDGNEIVFNHLATRHRVKAVEMFARIRVGGTIREVAETHRTGKRTMARLDPRELSNTILSLPDDLLHYAHNRILTVREAARLQTFDDDFVFFGKRTSGFVERRVDVPQYTQVGNAVPPVLARALGGALLQSLGGVPRDLRGKHRRRQRHQYVLGSSAYAGYVVSPDIADELVLATVTGAQLALPTDDVEMPVTSLPALRDWTQAPNPRRGQWSPGVVAKPQPSWAAVSVG
jgi:DNA (cytosine-5)-methyltransferase 1